MCKGMHLDMCSDKGADKDTGTCVRMCIDIFIDMDMNSMCLDMCTETDRGMYIHMSTCS